MKSTLTSLILGLFIVCSCEDSSYNPAIAYQVYYFSDDWEYGKFNTFSVGDSLILKWGITRSERPQYIDVSLIRFKSGDHQSEEVLIFDTFYPQSKNSIHTLRWKIDESITPTPEGYLDQIIFFTKYKGGQGTEPGHYIKIIE